MCLGVIVVTITGHLEPLMSFFIMWEIRSLCHLHIDAHVTIKATISYCFCLICPNRINDGLWPPIIYVFPVRFLRSTHYNEKMSENKNCQSRSSTDSFLLQLMTQIVEV